MKHLIIAAAALIAVAGCGEKTMEKMAEKAAEKALEKAMEREGGKDVDIDLKKGTLSMKTDKGDVSVSVSGDGKLPDNFPGDVPVYKGASIATALNTPQGISLVLKTQDTRAAVKEQYLKKMAANGWEKQAAMDAGGQVMLTFAKDGRQALVIIADDAGATMINLTVQPEAPAS